MIQELKKIFHSTIKSLEVLYVIEGTKKCARVLVFEEEINKVKGFLNGKGIFYEISDFKVIKQNVQSEFYSDKSIKISQNSNQKGHYFFYISKAGNLAEMAKAAEADSNHAELGLILGYPKCCIDFFAENFNENNSDLTLDILRNSEKMEFLFFNNICARHFDISLLSHFPHSFDCKPSIEIAKSNLKIIGKHGRKTASMFENILRSAVIYTIDEGIFFLRNYKKINTKIIYNDILECARTKLYYLLSSSKMLEIKGKNHFSVGGESIGGEGFGIMVFI